MTEVKCGRCGKRLLVALTSDEIKTNEIKTRYCLKPCEARPTKTASKPKRRRGATVEHVRERESQLGLAWRMKRGPKPAPAKASLIERLGEANVTRAIERYRRLEITGAEAAAELGCRIEEVYALDEKLAKSENHTPRRRP